MSKVMKSYKDEIEKELEVLKKKEGARGEFKKINWFSAEKGDNIVRILPAKKGLFFQRVGIHYGVPINTENGTIKIPARCLKELGEDDCPLCSAYDELIQDKRNKDRAKEYRVTERAVYNLFDYKSKEVKTWAAPITVHKDIILIAKECEESIVDMEQGRNFKIIKTVDAAKKSQFGTKYKVVPEMNASKVPSKMIAIIEESEVPEFDSLYTENRRNEMNAMLGISQKKSKVVEDDDDDVIEEKAGHTKPAYSGDDEDEADTSEMKFAESDDDEVEMDEEKEEKPKAKKTPMKVQDEDLDEELRRLGVD